MSESLYIPVANTPFFEMLQTPTIPTEEFHVVLGDLHRQYHRKEPELDMYLDDLLHPPCEEYEEWGRYNRTLMFAGEIATVSGEEILAVSSGNTKTGSDWDSLAQQVISNRNSSANSDTPRIQITPISYYRIHLIVKPD